MFRKRERKILFNNNRDSKEKEPKNTEKKIKNKWVRGMEYLFTPHSFIKLNATVVLQKHTKQKRGKKKKILQKILKKYASQPHISVCICKLHDFFLFFFFQLMRDATQKQNKIC